MQTRSRAPWLLYAIFFATGIATVQMGNVLPRIHTASRSDANTGLLLAMQFFGQLFGALFVRRRPGRAVTGGLLLAAVTAIVLAVSTSPSPLVLLAYGLGLGISMTAVNIVAGLQVAAPERNRRMQMLNVFWPLGAACAPLFVNSVVALGLPAQRSYGLMAVLLLAAAALFLARERAGSVHQNASHGEDRRIPLTRFAFLCTFALLAVGIESSLANWMPTYATRYIGASAAAIATTAFWCGILCGRLLADRFLKRVTWQTFAIVCSLLCAVATYLVAHVTAAATLAVAAFFAASMVAPLYPAVLALSVDVRWKNLVFIFGGGGSALVPWLVGRASTHSGSLRTALLVPVGAGVMLAMSTLFSLRNDAG